MKPSFILDFLFVVCGTILLFTGQPILGALIFITAVLMKIWEVAQEINDKLSDIIYVEEYEEEDQDE